MSSQTLHGGKLTVTKSESAFGARYKTVLNIEGRSPVKVSWPSVTGISGILNKAPVLVPWAVNLAGTHLRQYIERSTGPYTAEQLLPVIDEACERHRRAKDEAASVGEIVHQYAEKFAIAQMNGEAFPEIPDGIPDGSLLGINAFLDWVSNHKVMFLRAECLIASIEHEFQGELDFIAEVDGVPYLGDYKTSSGVYDEAWLQTAGYLIAWNEDPDNTPKLSKRMILHFSKTTGEFTAHVKDEHEDDVRAFIHARGLKGWLDEQKRG